MLPFPIINKTLINKTNTILKYLRDSTGSTVQVFGTNIFYNPSTLYYTEGYNAIRITAGPSYVQVGTVGVPSAYVIGDSTNFVIETYLYLTDTSTQMLIGNLNDNTGTGSYWLTLNNTFQSVSQISLDGYSTSGTVQRFRFGTTGSTKLPTGVWFKFKLERIGTLLSFYVDDVQVGSSQSMVLGFSNTSSNAYRIGLSSNGQYQLLGAIDSLIISTSTM